jgi:hypothetical protein
MFPAAAEQRRYNVCRFLLPDMRALSLRTFARGGLGLASSLALAALFVVSVSAQKNDKNAKDKDARNSTSDRPKLSITARPTVAIAPARVVLTAELTGGANDYEEYYCPSIRWEWGDLSSSETGLDCPPYEAGKTEIKRRFTIEHTFNRSGSYKVYFRMKHGSKDIAVTSITIKLQPGANDVD